MTQYNYGPPIPFAEEIHATKYREDGESFREAMNRIAGALTENSRDFYNFREILLDMRFLPGGRIQATVGSPRVTTPYNCFVSGEIEDSSASIMQRAGEAFETMRLGGGIGYDFSNLRPKGEVIASLGSKASGPRSFMDIYDAICKTVASAGHRRGAQMGVLRVDHPDIMEFIHAKQNTDQLTQFNLSIGITDEFMNAVTSGQKFDLKWNGRNYKTVDARAMWESIMRSTWDWAEPGVLFLDQINRMNNLWYCESIQATNPCAEQPLPANGACLLGSFNLTKYVYKNDNGDWSFNMARLAEDIPIVVEAMDNVVDYATYPLSAQEDEAKSKRRMGIGITGLANAAEAIGFPYGGLTFKAFTAKVLKVIRDGCYYASVSLALRKGSFPLYDKERYCDGAFVATLPEDLRNAIYKIGIRNSHLTSIAPTGTISLTAGNISSGLEPVFNMQYDRTIQTFEGPKVETIRDYGYRVFGTWPKTANELTAEEHLDVLLTAQKYVDSAVSKTCNVSPHMPWNDFKDIYINAWRGGAKGCTTFNAGGKRAGILTNTTDDQGTACYIDPTTGAKSCG